MREYFLPQIYYHTLSYFPAAFYAVCPYPAAPASEPESSDAALISRRVRQKQNPKPLDAGSGAGGFAAEGAKTGKLLDKERSQAIYYIIVILPIYSLRDLPILTSQRRRAIHYVAV